MANSSVITLHYITYILIDKTKLYEPNDVTIIEKQNI